MKPSISHFLAGLSFVLFFGCDQGAVNTSQAGGDRRAGEEDLTGDQGPAIRGETPTPTPIASTATTPAESPTPTPSPSPSPSPSLDPSAAGAPMTNP